MPVESSVAERILDVLQSRADAHGVLVISNREMAQLVGCSNGVIGKTYDQLEADGKIHRELSENRRLTRITLLERRPTDSIWRTDPPYQPWSLGTPDPTAPRPLPRRRGFSKRKNTVSPRQKLADLRELEQLRQAGTIDDAEFARLKREIIAS
jgi:DNA-binding transcriptional MocR family regulator